MAELDSKKWLNMHLRVKIGDYKYLKSSFYKVKFVFASFKIFLRQVGQPKFQITVDT